MIGARRQRCFLVGRHNLRTIFPQFPNASQDNGRVPPSQHVCLLVSIKTLQAATYVKKFRLAVNNRRNMGFDRGEDLVKSLHEGFLCKLLVLVAFLSINLTVCGCEPIAPDRCLIWGPGLNPDIVLPVRYFFIQAVDSNGENLTLSPGELATHTHTSVTFSTAANVS